MKRIGLLLLSALLVLVYSCGVCLQKRDVVLNNETALQRRNAVLFAIEDSLKTFKTPGGGDIVTYTGFFSPYFVCGSRGKYVRLYNYSQENLLKRHAKDKNQVKGWIKRGNMVDIESASLIKTRYLLAVNDYSLLRNPQRYFVNEDSVWLYNSSSLKEINGKMPLYKPVFLIKYSEKDSSSLVAESPYVPFPYSDLSSSGRWLSRVKIGWVSNKLLSPPVNDSIKRISLRDSANIKVQWTAGSFLTLKDADSVVCKRLNIVIVLPSLEQRYDNRVQMTKFFGESKKAICSGVRGVFGNYRVNYMAVEAGSNGVGLLKICESKDSTEFFDALAMHLSKNGLNADSFYNRLKQSKNDISVYELFNMLQGGLWDSLSAPGYNLVIILGGSAKSFNDTIPNKLLGSDNIVLLSCQIAENSSPGNRNFVIQSSDIIRKYAAQSTAAALDNRLFYMVPGGDSLLHVQSRMREYEDDMYLLDFPYNSFAIGGVIYPGLHKTLSGGKLCRGIGIILKQMSRRHRMIEGVIDKGFKMDKSNNSEMLRDSTLLPNAARFFFGKSQLYAYF